MKYVNLLVGVFRNIVMDYTFQESISLWLTPNWKYLIMKLDLGASLPCLSTFSRELCFDEGSYVLLLINTLRREKVASSFHSYQAIKDKVMRLNCEHGRKDIREIDIREIS